ncbi:MAG: response regulator [Bacteroidetes bacterium]|nr:response regulator [Bacteroidota bacterium]
MKSNKYILLVEDDDIDAMTVKYAFKEFQHDFEIIHVINGEEALEHIKQATDLPYLILSDWNMPRMNGLEMLTELRKDEGFNRIPVVVLTSSMDDQSRIEEFNLNVAAFMSKPVDHVQLLSLFDSLKLYSTSS